MALVTMTSFALCRNAMLPPGTSRMKWRFSSRSACTWFRARSTSAAAPIHTSTLSASGILTAQRMDLHGTDKVEVEHRLHRVVERRLDAELRRVAGTGGGERAKLHPAGGWKDCQDHSMFISINLVYGISSACRRRPFPACTS